MGLFRKPLGDCSLVRLTWIFCFFQLPPVRSFREALIQVVPTFWELFFGGKGGKLESWRPRVSHGTVTAPRGDVVRTSAASRRQRLRVTAPFSHAETFSHFAALTFGKMSSWKTPFVFNPLFFYALPPAFSPTLPRSVIKPRCGISRRKTDR